MGEDGMSKHTPGPWKVEHRGYKYIVSKSRDGYITRDVCRMDGSTMAAFAQEANAHLISAAPDMLDVLLRAKDAIEALDGTSADNEKLVDDYRAVIAKVEGAA
jgi:hypothetical protein